MPGVLLEESLGDPVKELVNRFHGPQEASNRQVTSWAHLKHAQQNGHNIGIQKKNGFQALFIFHLFNQSPISLENRFGLDLGTASPML